jgi:tetratricopeptide (TPR) repeat protein
VEYYLRRVKYADPKVMNKRWHVADLGDTLTDGKNPFADKESALGWLDVERANLLACVEVSSKSGWLEHTWTFAELLTALYFNRRYLEDWTKTAELGAAAAAQLGNHAAEARIRSVVSRAWTDLADLDRAGRETDAALAAARFVDDQQAVSSVWEFRGRYLDQVDPSKAIAAYRKCYELSPSSRGKALALHFLAGTYLALGQYADALENATTAHEMLMDNDARMDGRALLVIGQIYRRQGRLEEAEDTLYQALKQLKSFTTYEVQVRAELADMFKTRGDVEKQRAELTSIITLKNQVGDPSTDKEKAELARL